MAKAGSDTIIILPVDSLRLNGTASYDPDGKIKSYEWTRVSGAPFVIIQNWQTARPMLKNLLEGIYSFQLKVIDNSGLTATDTVVVSVEPGGANPQITCGTARPEIVVKVVPITTIPRVKGGSAVATGGKIFVFGGLGPSPGGREGSTNLDIYDIGANSWTTRELSRARIHPTAITNGNKIFFAGGRTGTEGDLDEVYYSDVDIYDLTTNTLSSTTLKEPATELSAAAVGNKVLFTGGLYGTGWNNSFMSNKVEIYDISRGTWTYAMLTETKAFLSVATLNNKVYFAGGVKNSGYSNKIEIYDNAADLWSVNLLSEGKVGMLGIGMGDKVYWAGGTNGSPLCTVEIKNISNGTTGIDYLSKPDTIFYNWKKITVFRDNKIVFFNSNSRFDIYNLDTQKWSVAVLPTNLLFGSVVFLNNTFYLVEGDVYTNNIGTYTLSNKIFKLDF